MKRNVCMALSVGLALAGCSEETPTAAPTFEMPEPQMSVSEPSLMQGLLAHYPFAGDATDATGNGNDGTVAGPVLAADRFGLADNAYWFDGVDDKIVLGDKFDDLNDLSIAVWVNMDAECLLFTRWCGFVVKHRDGANQQNLLKSFSIGKSPPGGTQNALWVRYYGGGLFTVTDVYDFTPLASDRWYFLVTTYGDGLARLYVDGLLVSETTINGPINDNSTPTIIGDNESNNHPMHGFIDDVRVYDRVLSQNEVTALMAELPDPGTNTDCMQGGWQIYGFTNQGQCLKFVNTGQDSR